MKSFKRFYFIVWPDGTETELCRIPDGWEFVDLFNKPRREHIAKYLVDAKEKALKLGAVRIKYEALED